MSKQSGLDEALIRAAQAGDAAALRLALGSGADAKAAGSWALIWAARQGCAECVTLLAPISDARASDSLALREAVGCGSEECVRLLIPLSDPKAEGSAALVKAAWLGHARCVALLLPVSDLKARDRRDLSAIKLARGGDYRGVAEMIEAFIEAQELAESIRANPPKAQQKGTL